MRSLFFTLFLFISLSLFLSCKDEPTPTSPNPIPIENDPLANLTDSEKELVNELNKFIKPLKGSSITNDDSDLQVFDIFANAKVIGVGEATHGTKEFFQMKHRLFKYFVEKQGFKIFGFEEDMGVCIYIDRFISQDIGTIDDAMNKIGFAVWKNQEVKDLILWMNQYNKSKSQGDKIHLLGVDCQYKDYNRQLVRGYLQQYDPNYPAFIDKILTDIHLLSYVQIKALTATEKNLLKIRCDSIKTYFDNNSSRLITSSGSFEFKITRQLLRQTQQYIDNTSTSYYYRDLYMAENTEWLTELLGPNTKVVQWAHNMHIAKNPSGTTSGTQGYVLSQHLSTQYKAIGFSFNYGSFKATGYNSQQNTYTVGLTFSINQLPPQDSFNYIFNYSQPQNFILLNSDILQNSTLYNWINSTKKFLSFGAIYYPDSFNDNFDSSNLGSEYDAMIHFHTTTASVKY
ncbi:MAG: erythromycin esterase family protein [Melioribacteraceae bacterium]